MERKIILVSHEYPPYIFGGIGTFCGDLSKKLAENRINTTVITGRTREVSKEEVNKYLTVVRLPILDFPPRHLWFQLQNLRNTSSFFEDKALIHCIRPDLSLLCNHFKKKYSIPLITSLHGIYQKDLEVFLNSPVSSWNLGEFVYNVLEYPLNEYLYKKALKESDQVITCSKATLNEVKSSYPFMKDKDIRVIHNAIEFSYLDKINERNPIQPLDKQKIVFYGRLYWRKGLTYLIYAVRNLIKIFPDLKLDIFGKGPMKNHLQKIIKENYLENNIEIRGHVDYNLLLTSIKNADAIVLPSLYEAQSIAMLEAMALQKTVVAFDYPFASEVIKNEYNGILVDPMNIDALSDSIIKLLSNPSRTSEIGSNAYNYVKSNHNWNLKINQYIDCYNQFI
jgi:glycosyltransferase involved in cell wall biosynthesis